MGKRSSRPGPRTRWILAAGCTVTAFATVSFVTRCDAVNAIGMLLRRPLESAFGCPPHADVAGAEGVIVLGGAFRRVEVAAEILTRLPHARLLASARGELERSRAYFRSVGLRDDRITLETVSKSTHENAKVAAAMLGTSERKSWILVTSAIHMPRAVGTFRLAGFTVVPWPVHHNDLNNWYGLQIAILEWVKLAGYWALGRTPEFWPTESITDAGFPAASNRTDVCALSY